MADRSRKSRKRDYLNDFQLNDKNQYEYHGNVFQVDPNNPKIKSTFVFLWISVVLLVLFQIVAGCLPFTPIMNGVFVILPYILGLGFMILFLYTFLLFFFKRKNLREYNFKNSVERFKPYSVIVMAAIIATLVGLPIYFLSGNPLDSLSLLIIFISLQLSEFACIFYASRTLRAIKIIQIQRKEEVFVQVQKEE